MKAYFFFLRIPTEKLNEHGKGEMEISYYHCKIQKIIIMIKESWIIRPCSIEKLFRHERKMRDKQRHSDFLRRYLCQFVGGGVVYSFFFFVISLSA
jgi:hypothetical protein